MSIGVPSKCVALFAAASAALVMAGCGGADSVAGTSWRALPVGPLSPREQALGLWTGREVLLIGGSDAPPCPPSASCVAPDVPPLADGAAFDPDTGTWRRIAPSPVPFAWAQGVVIGRTAYLWVPGTPERPLAQRAFLAYHVDVDRWQELRVPPIDFEFAGFVRAGERIVVYSSSDEHGEQPDLIFDPAANSWSELPPDPLSPSFDRWIAWSGNQLVLFDHELVANPGAEKPALTRAAALDLKTRSWRRLADSEILFTGPWAAYDGRLINPTLGGSDGGETNNWGRTYPNGGILDLRSNEWSVLPDPPEDHETFAAGVITDAGASYFGSQEWVFDATADEWLQVPPLESEGAVTGQAIVAAGYDLFVFGGARWKSHGGEATLIADALVWAP